jgi:YggT family protein
MAELLLTLAWLISLFEIVVIAAVILQLLLQGNVISYSNGFVKSLYQALYTVTEPALAIVRKNLPPAFKRGPVDFSPLVLILLCWVARSGLAVMASVAA